MRKSGLIAAAALIAVALPLTAVSASAQTKTLSGAGGGRSAPAAAPAAKVGGGVMVGGGGGAAFRGGVVGAGPRIGPQAGWSGPRPGWNGGPVYHRRHGSHFYGPGIGFGTGLLLGGALAAQPYYYGSGYGSGYGAPYYDEPYDDGYVYAAPAQGASPDDVAYCQQRYRSYDLRTGTYLNYDGNRYPCP